MDKTNVISSETCLVTPSAESGSGVKEFKRAKWLIMTILVLNLVYTAFILFGASGLYRSGYLGVVNIGYYFLYLLLWLIGCWRLTRMPQKSFRWFGWFVGAYTIFSILSIYLIPFMNNVLYGTALSEYGEPMLRVIGFFILFLGMLAICWNDGINYGAVSLIVTLNLVNLGMLFATYLPLNIVGSFASEMTYFAFIVSIFLVGAWWMLFKYTSPAVEGEDDGPSFKALVCNRVFIGVTAVMVLMIVTLSIIAKTTLNL